MTNNAIIETAKGLTFGTELEYTNITREKAAKAIHSVVGGTVRYYGGGYDAWQVTAPDGRIWKAVSDGSLTDRATSAEVVTPILKWEDMETLQDEHGKHLKLPAVQQAFDDLTNVWDVMFPVERYKFINEVVEKITVHIDRVEIEYKTDGLEAVIIETEKANGKNN